MLRAIKYEIRPTKVQAQAIRKACGCSRFVYNKALALKIESLDEAQLYLDKTFEAHVTGFGSVEFKRIAQRYRLTFQKHN